MSQVTIPVIGMHCASCAFNIQNVLRKAKGVNNCEVNYGNEKAKLDYDPSQTDLDKLSTLIQPLGYSLAVTHTMTNGEQMVGMDHSQHTGVGQTKDQKLTELRKQRTKVLFAMPAAVVVFMIMLWQIAGNSLGLIPVFPVMESALQPILLFLATISLFWVGSDFLKEVLIFAKLHVANMYTLVGIGTLTAYVYSAVIVLIPQFKQNLGLQDVAYFDVTVVVIGFVYFGKYLEARSKLITGEAISKLLDLQAKTAIVERNGKEVEIAVTQVQVGDILIVKPGGKIAVDGVVIEGTSAVDQSMITGEPLSVDKNVDDTLIGGTINLQSFLKFRATKVGADTMLAHIIKLVDTAQGSKAPIQGLADKISSRFVPAVLIISVITFVAWIVVGSAFMPFSQALAIGLMCFTGVLVIACPCALGLATPTAIIVGTGIGAEHGILIKDAASLEELYKVNVLVTDKTGTITNGKPIVTDILPAAAEHSGKLMQTLASLEKYSEHPVAKAIMAEAVSSGIGVIPVTDFEIIAGKGLKGKINGEMYWAGNTKLIRDIGIDQMPASIESLVHKGKTVVILASETEVIGVVAIADSIKANATSTVAALHRLGIKVVMLTGDNHASAMYIAEQTGIDEVIADVLPADKAERIRQLQAAGNIVAMVGDGVNDAPALAQANVGIAMSTGTDVAIESAAITLLMGDFSKVLEAIKLSRATLQTIKQNLFWAFVYNVVGIPLAAGLLFPIWGILLNPVFAGAAMALSSISVVVNSLRLRTIKL